MSIRLHSTPKASGRYDYYLHSYADNAILSHEMQAESVTHVVEEILSGVGVAVVTAVFTWLRVTRRPASRKLTAVVKEIRSSSLAIEQEEAFNSIVGMKVWFDGRVLDATAPDDVRVAVNFEVSRDLHASCVFERSAFPGIALLKERHKKRVIGTITRATRNLIEICPLPNASCRIDSEVD